MYTLGYQLIIPEKARLKVLNLLHESHPGISRMKTLARGYVWWPKLDENLTETVQKCSECKLHQAEPGLAPLHPWEFRLHLDFAGRVQGKMLLIITDAHSKWIEVHVMNSITTENTLEKLRVTLACFGLPYVIVTDNAATFTSEKWRIFMRNNNIKHITSAPYHPSSNGMAEKAVQTVKRGIVKQKEGTLETKLQRFL